MKEIYWGQGGSWGEGRGEEYIHKTFLEAQKLNIKEKPCHLKTWKELEI